MSDSNPTNPAHVPSAQALDQLLARAEQGDAEAQFNLGVHFGCAPGAGLDFAQSARWYHRAAEQNHALAQFNLAIMFARGQGVGADEPTSAQWMLRAAQGGDAGGQYHLGVRCHRASMDPLASGAAESRIEGYKWLQLASAQGYRDSLPAWERLTMTMSHAEVTQGNQRVADFVPRSHF